jgi:ATP-binding cassette subfamily C (CFTR/MRP) protein 1
MMRGGLISMLYGKATEVVLTDVDTAASLTLMSADIERIVTGMETSHEVRDIKLQKLFKHVTVSLAFH